MVNLSIILLSIACISNSVAIVLLVVTRPRPFRPSFSDLKRANSLQAHFEDICANEPSYLKKVKSIYGE